MALVPRLYYELEYRLQLKIMHNDWLLADTVCLQPADHTALSLITSGPGFFVLDALLLSVEYLRLLFYFSSGGHLFGGSNPFR